MGKDRTKGVVSLPIYHFPDKKKKTNTRKQETTKSLVEKATRLINQYDPKMDPALKEFKRKIRDIWRF